MIPKFPLTQPFDELPDELPLYAISNGLLPGGELPITLDEPSELVLFIDALKTDQLIGVIQCKPGQPEQLYGTGCAGRIRQYRERKDGKVNLMLTGICRYKVIQLWEDSRGYRKARVDWQPYRNDYDAPQIDPEQFNLFKERLRHYFKAHHMQVDWDTLERLDPEELVSNLVLVSSFGSEFKQKLIETVDLETRLELYTRHLEQKPDPITGTNHNHERVN